MGVFVIALVVVVVVVAAVEVMSGTENDRNRSLRFESKRPALEYAVDAVVVTIPRP